MRFTCRTLSWAAETARSREVRRDPPAPASVVATIAQTRGSPRWPLTRVPAASHRRSRRVLFRLAVPLLRRFIAQSAAVSENASENPLATGSLPR